MRVLNQVEWIYKCVIWSSLLHRRLVIVINITKPHQVCTCVKCNFLWLMMSEKWKKECRHDMDKDKRTSWVIINTWWMMNEWWWWLKSWKVSECALVLDYFILWSINRSVWFKGFWLNFHLITNLLTWIVYWVMPICRVNYLVESVM